MDSPVLVIAPSEMESWTAREVYKAKISKAKILKKSKLSRFERRFVKSCNGSRSVEKICRQINISVTMGHSLSAKLRLRGAITLVDKQHDEQVAHRTSCSKLSGFSMLEENFFNSEVQPIDECDEPFQTLTDRLAQSLVSLKWRLIRI